MKRKTEPENFTNLSIVDFIVAPQRVDLTKTMAKQCHKDLGAN